LAALLPLQLHFAAAKWLAKSAFAKSKCLYNCILLWQNDLQNASQNAFSILQMQSQMPIWHL